MDSTVMSGKIGGLSFFFLPILGKVGIAQCARKIYYVLHVIVQFHKIYVQFSIIDEIFRYVDFFNISLNVVVF